MEFQVGDWSNLSAITPCDERGIVFEKKGAIGPFFLPA